MTRADNLIGYILAEYIDGDDSEPTRSDCVDRYAFNAIEKHHAYLLKTLRPAQVCPVLPSPLPSSEPFAWANVGRCGERALIRPGKRVSP